MVNDRNNDELSIYKRVFIEKIRDFLYLNYSEILTEDLDSIALQVYNAFNETFAYSINSLVDRAIDDYLYDLNSDYKRRKLETAQELRGEKYAILKKTIGLIGDDIYHRPIYCKRCGDVLVFHAPGSYKCGNCTSIEYDDYGKVREFLYSHQGASAEDIEENTGVGLKAVRQMLREDKIEECNGRSLLSLTCLRCGKPIPSGKLCLECLHKYNAKIESDAKEILETKRKEMTKNIQVYGKAKTGDSGELRFIQGNNK